MAPLTPGRGMRALRLLIATCALSPTFACSSSGPANPGGAADAGSGDHGAGDQGLASDAASDASSGVDSDTPARGVRLVNGSLEVDGVPFTIQGVAWNPVGLGQTHPAGLDYAGYAAQDATLMAAAGLNAVRTYEPLTDRAVLDTLYSHGIYVLNTVYVYGGDDVNNVSARVQAVRDHPAILMWLVGNEWNYNGLYTGLTLEQSRERLNQAAALIRAADSAHPIATVYGELPSEAMLAAMPGIDVWGINSYRGITFGSLFDDWSALSAKPMFLAEYGADAWNALLPAEDQGAQADAVLALTREILAESAAAGRGSCLGGALFEWADEWWKDGAGALDAHDVGGIAPGGGPHPDATFNEEWWGVVDIDRVPRQAYGALQTAYGVVP